MLKRFVAVVALAAFGLVASACELDMDERTLPAEPQAAVESIR